MVQKIFPFILRWLTLRIIIIGTQIPIPFLYTSGISLVTPLNHSEIWQNYILNVVYEETLCGETKTIKLCCARRRERTSFLSSKLENTYRVTLAIRKRQPHLKKNQSRILGLIENNAISWPTAMPLQKWE